MDPRFFRKYADLVEAAEQDNPVRQQLDEGMMDMLKGMASKVVSKLSGDEIQKMKSVAQSVIGKSSADASDFTLDNIKAISQKLGVQQPSEQMNEGVVDGLTGMVKKASGAIGGAVSSAGDKVSNVLGQKKVDPKSGKGTIGSVNAWNPRATLGEKLVSLTGIFGGTAATIAGFFGAPPWLIIPGVLALIFMSQVGGTKERGHY